MRKLFLQVALIATATGFILASCMSLADAQGLGPRSAPPIPGQLQGSGTNDNASAGKVGEYISSSVAGGSAVSVPATTNTINITSISLTAGDWDVCGSIASILDAGTIVTAYIAGTSQTSATLPTFPNGGAAVQYFGMTYAAGSNQAMLIGCRRYSFASTTTVYLTGRVDFSGGAASLYGFIGARRSR